MGVDRWSAFLNKKCFRAPLQWNSYDWKVVGKMALDLLTDCVVFKHHQPFSIEYLETRVLMGQEGCFRTRIQEEGCDPEIEAYVAVAVQQSVLGAEEGTRVLKVGVVKPGVLNSKDLWPEAPEGKVTVLPFDLSEFPAVNGLMTSGFVELPFKLKVKEGENWKTVKEGERVDRGYGGLIMRLFMWPKSTTGGEFMVTCLPVALADRGTLGDMAKSRTYPGIKIHKGKFRFASPELPNQKFGLGNQPFMVLTDVEVGEDDEVDLSNVSWLTSMGIKTMVANTLAEATLPNWHNKTSTWKEAVQKKKFVRKAPGSVWPAPIQEDGEETASEQDPESEGETGLDYPGVAWSLVLFEIGKKLCVLKNHEVQQDKWYSLTLKCANARFKGGLKGFLYSRTLSSTEYQIA